MVADYGAIYVRVTNFGGLNRRAMGGKWVGFRYPGHVNYFTTRSLAAMAGDYGLKLKLLNQCACRSTTTAILKLEAFA